MNASLASRRSDRPRRATAPWARSAVLALLVSGFASAQDPFLALVAADAAALLAHRDGTARGEAALLAAERADHAVQGRLLALAADPDPQARQRALLALGRLGTPGAVQFLAGVLDGASRSDDDAVPAAFALGLVRDHAAASVTTQWLSRAQQGNWKRLRDPLLAFLHGLAREAGRPETPALQQIFDDSSNRDPEVRALLLHHLLAGARHDGRAIRRLLERGSTAEREVVLRWLANDATAIDADTLAALELVAAHDDSAEHRALALGALLRARHRAALELARQALRAGSPAECALVLPALRRLGGGDAVRNAIPRVLGERDPLRKAALLAGCDAPLSAAFADHLAQLASDDGQPVVLRSAGALLLARAEPGRAAPLLAAAFRASDEEPVLGRLARALLTASALPPPLAELLAPGQQLAQLPRHWVALLRAGHPAAERAVLAGLRDGEQAPAALRVARVARVLALPIVRDAAVPARLRELLAP